MATNERTKRLLRYEGRELILGKGARLSGQRNVFRHESKEVLSFFASSDNNKDMSDGWC